MRPEATVEGKGTSRREILVGGASIAAGTALVTASASPVAASSAQPSPVAADVPGATVTTKDGVRIFYKDWGAGQPIVFHHGWPLSSDDWDAQMLYFLGKGYGVVAFDRRGHGRSSQVGSGHDMDHYAADAAAVVEHLDLRDAVHVGHSTGGGQAARYVARYGRGRVAKPVMIGAVPPIMVKTGCIGSSIPGRVSACGRRGPFRAAPLVF